MTGPAVLEPIVGDWFQSRGALFEVVAVDDAIEIQYHDGSVEEMEFEEWALRCKAGALQAAEQPEDFSGAIDCDPEDESNATSATFEAEGALHASGLDNLDLFE
jgi:hypothetical protein